MRNIAVVEDEDKAGDRNEDRISSKISYRLLHKFIIRSHEREDVRTCESEEYGGERTQDG